MVSVVLSLNVADMELLKKYDLCPYWKNQCVYVSFIGIMTITLPVSIH